MYLFVSIFVYLLISAYLLHFFFSVFYFWSLIPSLHYIPTSVLTPNYLPYTCISYLCLLLHTCFSPTPSSIHSPFSAFIPSSPSYRCLPYFSPWPPSHACLSQHLPFLLPVCLLQFCRLLSLHTYLLLSLFSTSICLPHSLASFHGSLLTLYLAFFTSAAFHTSVSYTTHLPPSILLLHICLPPSAPLFHPHTRTSFHKPFFFTSIFLSHSRSSFQITVTFTTPDLPPLFTSAIVMHISFLLPSLT